MLLQYRDLPHNAVLAVSVWGLAEAQPLAPLGGTTMRLFSKKVQCGQTDQVTKLLYYIDQLSPRAVERFTLQDWHACS